MTLILGGGTPNFSQPKKKNKIEQGTHLALAHWIRLMEPQFPQLKWAYHCPSGGKRGIVEAAIFKRMLVRPGISDLCFPFPGYKWAAPGTDYSAMAGMYLELKAPEGVITPDQNDFLRFVAANKYIAVVCFSFETAQKRIMDYLGPIRR